MKRTTLKGGRQRASRTRDDQARRQRLVRLRGAVLARLIKHLMPVTTLSPGQTFCQTVWGWVGFPVLVAPSDTPAEVLAVLRLLQDDRIIAERGDFKKITLA